MSDCCDDAAVGSVECRVEETEEGFSIHFKVNNPEKMAEIKKAIVDKCCVKFKCC
jgi:hypothetical protein